MRSQACTSLSAYINNLNAIFTGAGVTTSPPLQTQHAAHKNILRGIGFVFHLNIDCKSNSGIIITQLHCGELTSQHSIQAYQSKSLYQH